MVGLQKESWGFSAEEPGGGHGGAIILLNTILLIRSDPCVRYTYMPGGAQSVLASCVFSGVAPFEKSLVRSLSNSIEKLQPWTQVWPRNFFSFLLEYKKGRVEHLVKILMQLCLWKGCCHSITPSLTREADSSWSPSVSCFMALTHTQTTDH